MMWLELVERGGVMLWMDCGKMRRERRLSEGCRVESSGGDGIDEMRWKLERRMIGRMMRVSCCWLREWRIGNGGKRNRRGRARRCDGRWCSCVRSGKGRHSCWELR
mmetsp:Transcript_3795/g.8362  ORF Transcript_3795/g.8362 Transcript_3795/m.8362 type:complete len:106 (+) Transcript_3795:77-394(+)